MAIVSRVIMSGGDVSVEALFDNVDRTFAGLRVVNNSDSRLFGRIEDGETDRAFQGSVPANTTRTVNFPPTFDRKITHALRNRADKLSFYFWFGA